MKNIIIALIFCVLAQHAGAQQTAAEQIADRIAKKISDTLNLSASKKQAIYTANLSLHQQKAALWQQYANMPDTLTRKVQLVENTRDSIYRVILEDDSKWLLYKTKKAALLNNN